MTGSKTSEEQKEEEASVSLYIMAAATVISADVALVTVLSELDDVFALK